MANVITSIRIVCALALLFCPALSASFYMLYIFAGFTDMIDGFVARKTNTVSEFGSKLDTVADFILVLVCLIKLIPIIKIESWTLIWIGIIVIIKMINIVSGFVVQKRFVSIHSVMNKIVGGLLFVFPFMVRVLDLQYSATIACTLATFAAIQEEHYILTFKEKSIVKDETRSMPSMSE